MSTDESRVSRRTLLGAGAGVAAAGAVGRGDAALAESSDNPIINAEAAARSAATQPNVLRAQALPPTVPGAVVATSTIREAVGYNPGVTDALVPEFLSGGINAVWCSAGVVLTSLDAPLGARIVRVDCYGARTTSGTQQWLLLDIDPTTGVVAEIKPATTSSTFPAGTSVSPTSFTGLDLLVTPGRVFFADLLNSSATNMFVSVIYQYLPATRPFHPVVPFRVYDSRITGSGGPLTTNTSRNVSVKDAINAVGGVANANAVPADSSAIAYNITAADTQGQGFLAVTPGGETSFSASTINWSSAGQLIANAATVSIDANRSIQVFAGGGGSTNFIIDVTGYYL